MCTQGFSPGVDTKWKSSIPGVCRRAAGHNRRASTDGSIIPANVAAISYSNHHFVSHGPQTHTVEFTLVPLGGHHILAVAISRWSGMRVSNATARPSYESFERLNP